MTSADAAAGLDVAVVGGGIVALGAALRCAMAGAKVAMFDAGLEGKASAAGAGIVSPVGLGGNEASPEWARLVASSIAHYHRLLDLVSDAGITDVGFAQVGELVVATREDDLPRLDALEQRLRRLAADGIPVGRVERLDGAGLTSSWPELQASLQGVLIENIARLDGRRMCTVLGEVAERHGARRVSGRAEIVPPARDGGSATLLVDGAPVKADSIVVATGAWAGEPLKALGARVAVQPVRGQILHLQLAGERTGTRPVVNSFEGHYFLGFPQGRIVTGATHEPDAGFEPAITAGGVHQVLERALRIAPGLDAAKLIEIRVGLRPRSSDGYPILGRTAGSDNVFFATGLGAWGLTLGPLVGHVAAELALGLDPSFAAEFLRPDREPITDPAALSPHIPVISA